jgi:hypothetical protein
MTKKGKKLKYQVILEEFVASRGWEDLIEVDEDEQYSALNTGVNFGDYAGGKLIVEGWDKSDLVSVFFYLPFECKEAKRTEMCCLLNDINARGTIGGYGCFQLLDSGDDRIRWVLKVDFEGSAPTAKSIEQMVAPGWSRVAGFIDVIRVVALTKQTAVDALVEFDSSSD